MNHLLRQRTTAHSNGQYKYHQGALFTPGVQNLVFEVLRTLPVQQIVGPGIRAGSPPNPLQPPQVFANHAAPVAGIGTVAGSWHFQPLFDPNG